MSVSDTSAEALAHQIERWRTMSYAEKATVVAELNRDVQRMADAGVRRRYPNANEREVFLRTAALRNGRALSVAAYGWNPDIEGW